MDNIIPYPDRGQDFRTPEEQGADLRIGYWVNMVQQEAPEVLERISAVMSEMIDSGYGPNTLSRYMRLMAISATMAREPIESDES